MSLDRSVPADRLKSRRPWVAWALQPRFATASLPGWGLAGSSSSGHCWKWARGGAGRRPWCSGQASFLAFWTLKPRIPGRKKGPRGACSPTGSLGLPRPQRKSKRPFFLLFFSGVCVVLRRGGPRGLSAPQQGQANPETEGRRPAAGQASEESWGLAGGRPRSSVAGQRAGNEQTGGL